MLHDPQLHYSNLITDSIHSLIYTEERGEYRGYRIDLLTENAPDNIKNLIFCCDCGGISRNPQLTEGKTFCTPCSKGTSATVDSRVDEIVSQLKSRCPLSTRGCDWSGQLGDIEQHMGVCEKLRLDCETGCGEVLERCEADEHLKKCPLRREQCEYCSEEIAVSEANQHIALCPVHPDGSVLCPYKELGCDVLGIQRKNLDAHLADDSIGHQKLLLREIRQLRSENDKLRNASEIKECENSTKFNFLKRRHVTTHKIGWMMLSLAVLGIAILVSHLHTDREQIDGNTQSIPPIELSVQSNKHSIDSNKQALQSNGESIQLVEQSMQSNRLSIQSNIQSIESNRLSIQSVERSMKFLIPDTLPNATYLDDYIQDRRKTLQGVEWTHKNVAGETYYGPIFYLGTCKLRLHVSVSQVSKNIHDAKYYVTRLMGDYDDISNRCHITYVHLYSVDMRDNSRYNVKNRDVSERLRVGYSYWVNQWFNIYIEKSLSIQIIRIYFDFE